MTHTDPQSPTPPPFYLNRTLLASVGGAALLLLVLLLLLRPVASEPQLSVRPAPDGPAIIAPHSHILETDGAIPQIGHVAPDFKFVLADGAEIKLSDYRGQKVILNFWASWCAPCKAEMPDLQNVYMKYRDQGVVILAINKEEDLATVEQFATQMGLSFPIIANEDGDISRQYGALGLPTTYFINSDGTVALLRKGVMDEAFILRELGQLR